MKWVWLGVALGALLLILIIVNQPAPKPEAKKVEPKIPLGYQKRFCDDPQQVIPEGESLKLDLTVGCYAGPVFLKGWGYYQIDKSQHEGDWASMWCNGREKPEKPHPYFEDFEDKEFMKCSKFYLQGKGIVHFTRLK